MLYLTDQNIRPLKLNKIIWHTRIPHPTPHIKSLKIITLSRRLGPHMDKDHYNTDLHSVFPVPPYPPTLSKPMFHSLLHLSLQTESIFLHNQFYYLFHLSLNPCSIVCSAFLYAKSPLPLHLSPHIFSIVSSVLSANSPLSLLHYLFYIVSSAFSTFQKSLCVVLHLSPHPLSIVFSTFPHTRSPSSFQSFSTPAFHRLFNLSPHPLFIGFSAFLFAHLTSSLPSFSTHCPHFRLRYLFPYCRYCLLSAIFFYCFYCLSSIISSNILSPHTLLSFLFCLLSIISSLLSLLSPLYCLFHLLSAPTVHCYFAFTTNFSTVFSPDVSPSG